MKLFKWLPGRQTDVKYKKLCFLHLRIGRYGFDGYVLKYPAYFRLPLHTDPLEGGKMWRFNLTLWGKALTRVYSFRRILFFKRMGWFRPDIYPHAVTTWTKTWKLSLGFAKFDK